MEPEEIREEEAQEEGTGAEGQVEANADRRSFLKAGARNALLLPYVAPLMESILLSDASARGDGDDDNDNDGGGNTNQGPSPISNAPPPPPGSNSNSGDNNSNSGDGNTNK